LPALNFNASGFGRGLTFLLMKIKDYLVLALVFISLVASYYLGKHGAEKEFKNKAALEFRNHTISPYKANGKTVQYHKYDIHHYDYQVGYIVLPTEIETGNLYIYVRKY
jgi:hypothetical protein